ncbi:AraC family transcriptional regulator [Lacrimispora sp.]|uniref:AraC family transcriptional regulator n=1 Tax=Lacrimispora sp. TaxID=2719234 RepID=UPI0028A66CD2|nr:AraC family transcriptional regulator [Lacrimispora sp.]
MEWVALIQKAIDYMEDHLLEKINYEDAAKQVHMSSYNFHRTFSLMAGMTANEYIRNRRLSLAGQELQLTNIKIIDVAYKYGYETPESFSKAFSRFHGVSPKLATVKGTQLSLFNALVIKIVLEGGKSMDYRVEAVGKRTFISKVMAFRNEIINEEDNNEIPQFWDRCRKEDILNQMFGMRPEGKKDLYGLCSPTKENETTFDYGIGVLLDEETVAGDEISLQNQGFQIWDVDPAEYVVFKCYGDNGDCIGEAWSRFFKEFLPQSGYVQTEDTDMEVYYDLEEPGLFCELWIPIEKKKEIN